MDQVTINEGLQIKPHPDLGYRTKVGVYVVKEDIYVVGGYAQNNVYDAFGNYIGTGGYYQYHIPNYETALELIEEINLQNITNPK